MTRPSSLVLACLVAACQLPSSGGSGDGGADAGDDFAVHLCDRLSGCMIATSDCVTTYRAFDYGPSCQSALLTASCSDLSAASPTGALAACYPACAAPGSAVCNGTTYTECTASGIAQAWHCGGLCGLKGKTFSGTCGDKFEGQMSATPICWCK